MKILLILMGLIGLSGIAGSTYLLHEGMILAEDVSMWVEYSYFAGGIILFIISVGLIIIVGNKLKNRQIG